MEDARERIEKALGAMATGPSNLRLYLEQPAPDIARATPTQVEHLLGLLLSANPEDESRLRFSNLLRSWDNAPGAKWADDTTRNTATRRKLIHQKLSSGPELEQRIDTLLPFYHLSEPNIIAKEHQDWYAPNPGIHDYYWRTYLKYLKDRRGWSDFSTLTLDNSTRAIIECFANPESPQTYSSRGLVMGYVQSGKTANFMGVVARAADAGYRLIIILAGTWNILRNQTQRRFDKDLLGKELLRNDEAYTQQPPSDWDEFLEHGTNPADLGEYIWQRLTRPDFDFKSLKAAIDNLEYNKLNKSAPLYDPSNLHALPVKLLVVKKSSVILGKLVKDFKLLQTKLPELPTLVIDDESDQAGLNTRDPRKAAAGEKERTKTNARIIQLLNLFPRGQYAGYTATPYANALVDPNDPEDLFPNDFIISLDRPEGYMGISDFFDPTSVYDDLDKDDFSQPEIAFIRRVESPIGEDDEDLKRALRSYILAGGVKLFREAKDPARYKPQHLKHHTMLVHTSSSTGEHSSIAGRLKTLWDECAFNSPRGRADLEKLWNDDFLKVFSATGNEITPNTFAEIVSYLSKAIGRIEGGPEIFLLVNSDENSKAPDFSAAPVWKVLVGGNKLSRGYTIEGLTVSYYRRTSGTADTLMQMGRWFGFRPGYRDLVRVFLGVKEGKHGDVDLVSQFKEVCRMEEAFRAELTRYIRRHGAKRITPRDIPPLIAVFGDLPPTAKNKMFNAVLSSKNFGGQRSMPTLSPAKPDSMEKNVETLESLANASVSLGAMSLGGTLNSGKTTKTNAVVLETTNEALIAFLKGYRWLESEYRENQRPTSIALQIEFLEKQKHGINSWLILAPQRDKSFGDSLSLKDGCNFAVKERHRAGGRGFQGFGEPDHRTIGEFLTGTKSLKSVLATPNEATKSLQDKHRGVCLLYPVREKREDLVTVGFELLFPENDLSYDLNFTVRRKDEEAKIVVENSSGR